MVIRRRYLGDIVLFGPVFRNLRQHYPQSQIAFLVNEKYADVQANNPDVNEILSIPGLPCKNKWVYVRDWFRLLRKLRGRFDIVYDFERSARSILLMKWSGATHRISYSLEGRSHKRERHFDVLANWTDDEQQSLHMLDLSLKLLEADGIPILTREVKLHVPESDVLEAQEFLRATLKNEEDASPKSTFVMVHPGARMPARCWPEKNFAAVCDALQSQTKAAVFLLAGPGEEEQVQAVGSAMQTRVRILESPTTVPKLAALLQAADLFICNDSGPMHVAAAVGTPVLALFGAQLTSLFHPVGAHSTVLQASKPCPCPFPDLCQPPNSDKMLCVRRISVETVIAAARRLLHAT